MKNNRRDFLKLTGLAGLGLSGSGFMPGYEDASDREKSFFRSTLKLSKKKHRQKFNMSGFAAPKLDTVRIGFIGLGNRGPAAVKRMSKLQNVEIRALCDLRPEKAEEALERIEGIATTAR